MSTLTSDEIMKLRRIAQKRATIALSIIEASDRRERSQAALTEAITEWMRSLPPEEFESVCRRLTLGEMG